MKSREKLGAQFLGGCLMAVGAIRDIGQALAGEETGGWAMPEPTGGVPTPIEDIIVLSVRKWIVLPLFAGGVIAYAAAFWFKFKKKDSKRTRRMLRIGMILLLLAAAIWAAVYYFIAPALFSGGA